MILVLDYWNKEFLIYPDFIDWELMILSMLDTKCRDHQVSFSLKNLSFDSLIFLILIYFQSDLKFSSWFLSFISILFSNFISWNWLLINLVLRMFPFFICDLGICCFSWSWEYIQYFMIGSWLFQLFSYRGWVIIRVISLILGGGWCVCVCVYRVW